MAVKPYQKIDQPSDNLFAHFWVLNNGDTGQPIQSGAYADKTVQIFGTFGVGGSVTLEGSNDSRVQADLGAGTSTAVWFPLTDFQANAITKTAAAGELVSENPVWIRPNCTAGDGTTAINVNFTARKL